MKTILKGTLHKIFTLGHLTQVIHRGPHELLSSICTHCHNLFSVICGYIFTSLTFLCSAFNWLQCFCMSVGKSNVIHQMIYILFTNPISQYNSNLKWILYTPLFPSERKVEIYIKKMTKLIENKQHTNGNCMVIHKICMCEFFCRSIGTLSLPLLLNWL